LLEGLSDGLFFFTLNGLARSTVKTEKLRWE
jgi:hypothetical protein